MAYQDNLKYSRDLKNSLDTARAEGREEGREEGRAEGMLQIASNMLQSGYTADEIMKLTGLHKEQIEKLK